MAAALLFRLQAASQEMQAPFIRLRGHPGGDEAVHCILDVMYAKAPYTVLQRAMHIHPTVSELIPTLLEDLKPLGGG